MLLQIPEWIGTAVVGAIVATLGYVGKLLVELFQAHRDKQRLRRSKLIELQSLLKANEVAFLIQNGHAQTLTRWIETNYPDVSQKLMGYEDKISGAYIHLNKQEKELHSLIRSITINALLPTNKAILEWLRTDNFFRANKSTKQTLVDLSKMLATLDAHLILWLAKYEALIPSYPEHALVYMADERKHGLGFPTGIDALVNEAVRIS